MVVGEPVASGAFERARGLYLGELSLKRRHSSLLARVMEPDAIHGLAGAESEVEMIGARRAVDVGDDDQVGSASLLARLEEHDVADGRD